MPSHLSRRNVLLVSAAAYSALALAAAPAHAHRPPPRPFGRYGSPSARLTPATLYVHPRGAGDFTGLQAAVDAATGTGRTLVIAPGVYRETVSVPADRTGMTWLGASEDPRDVVVVYDNAAYTPRPDGSGTYGTSGSATTTLRPDGFTARRITFANDWLRAYHRPGVSGTQAVAVKVTGDRSAFLHCRFLGHQDTLYADTASLDTVARQYFAHCYAEGDVDFVFGRATAVFEDCDFRTLTRPDLTSAPFGFVFAPSTAVTTPRGFLVTGSRIGGDAPDGSYKLARPWCPAPTRPRGPCSPSATPASAPASTPSRPTPTWRADTPGRTSGSPSTATPDPAP